MQALENEGRYWKVRIGDRSTLPGLYTNFQEAQRALDSYNEEVSIAKAKTAARKTRSDKGSTKSKED